MPDSLLSSNDDTSMLLRWGRASWLVLGIVAVASVAYSGLSAISGLVAPLVVAVVLGMLAAPLVDRLERRRVPRSVGSILVLLGIVVAVLGSIALAVKGAIDEGDEVTKLVTAGLDSVDVWLEDLDIDAGVAADRVEQAKEFGIDLIPGLAGWFTTAFSGAVSLLAGCFLGLFLLYFVLADWERLRDWVGSHLGIPADLGADVVDDATVVIREGFSALTISSFVTAVIIGIAMVILDVPLALTVALVTFVTSYIPYLGAIVSGAFAFLIALGSGGLTDALILLIVILVVQNVVQTVMTTKLTSDRLSIHPIANIISTIVGASLAGLLGATLSAPFLAMVIRISRRVQAYNAAAPLASGAETIDDDHDN